MPKATMRDQQVAIRRMCLNGKGGLTPDARLIAVGLKRFCRADKTSLMYSPQTGMIDPVATAAAVARREVYDYLRRLLNIDDYVETNLREED